MASASAAQSSPMEGPIASRADPRLLAPGGPFGQFPGAALLAGRDGRVLGANAAAQPLADLLAQGATPELQSAIATALGGKAAQINPFLMAGAGNGTSGEAAGEESQVHDLVVLPWEGGSAVLLLARDITLERSLRAALIESRLRYKDLIDASSDFAWETDGEGRFAFVSPRGALGYAAAQLFGQKAEDFIVAPKEVTASPFTTRVPVERAEFWFRGADGEAACLSAIALPLPDSAGVWRGARGVCRDITRERAREAELVRARHREALLGYILRIVRDELEPATMLKAAAGALVTALSARGVAIYRRDGGERLSRTAEAGRLPPADFLKTLLARVASGEDEVSAPCRSGRLFLKATRYRLDWNGVLCLWSDSDAGHRDEENKVLLGEVAAQIGVANEQLAREHELEKG